MRLSCALLLILALLAGGIFYEWVRLSLPTVDAMKSHQSSRERLRQTLHRNLNGLLERKRGVPFNEWDDGARFEYEAIRRLLAEEGQSIPERPDTP